MTKIFYLITKGNMGGAQKYLYDLAKNLPRDDFDVTVFLGEGAELKQKLEVSGIKTRQLENLGRDVSAANDWRTFWQLFRIFKQEQPDIIHLNSSKIGALGALAGRSARVRKIIFTGHGWAFNEPRPFWQKVIIKFLHWLTVLLCHKTIAVSEKTRDQLAYLPFIKKKFTVIHNGLEPIDFLSQATARSELASKIWKKDLDFDELNKIMIIGTVAELHKNKGQDCLLKALGQIKNKLENAVIWIIGDGNERDSLKQQIKDEGLSDHVFLLGQIPEAKKYMRAFDIFTFTSRTEAFPYAILEAGQAGLPIIASTVGGIPEIISDFHQGILVRPCNLKEIRLALSRLISSHKERTKFGHNIQKKVCKEFTIEKMVKETMKLYI